MKRFINRLLSAYTSYDLLRLQNESSKLLTSLRINAKYFLVDKVIDIFERYSYYCIVVFAILLSLIYNDHVALIASIAGAAIFLTILSNYLTFQKDKFFMIRSNQYITELDNLITECLREYLSLNLYEGVKYISSDQEDIIKKEIVNMVSSRMSNLLYKKLCIQYKESAVYNIIAVHITLAVMDYVINTNREVDSGSSQDRSNYEDSIIPYLLEKK